MTATTMIAGKYIGVNGDMPVHHLLPASIYYQG